MIKNILAEIKKNWILYSILLFGFCFRLFYIFTSTTPGMYLWSDPGGYDLRALKMASGQFVSGSTYWPPFFHIFLSLIYLPLRWLGLTSLRISIDVILFSIFYLIAFWCVYKIVEKLFSKKIGLIVLGIMILWYPFIFLNYLIMSENLFFLLLFLGLYLLIVKPIKPSTGIWLGLLWGSAFLCRPIFAFVIPFFLIWAFHYKINRKTLLLFGLVVGFMVLLMMGFNSWYTGGAERSISSNGGVGFAMLWCDAKSLEFSANNSSYGLGPPANIDYPESSRIFTKVPFENQKYYYNLGINCINSNPWWILNGLSSVSKVFYSHLFPTIGNVSGWEELRVFFRNLTLVLFLLNIITFIGILSNRVKVDEIFKKYFYFFFLILFSLLIAVFLQGTGEERYLIPYAPLIIILDIPLLLSLLHKNRKNKN
jgi:4-amino-4-deoxy-L-arabinose transferase-like glycosyltransferase